MFCRRLKFRLVDPALGRLVFCFFVWLTLHLVGLVTLCGFVFVCHWFTSEHRKITPVELARADYPFRPPSARVLPSRGEYARASRRREGRPSRPRLRGAVGPGVSAHGAWPRLGECPCCTGLTCPHRWCATACSTCSARSPSGVAKAFARLAAVRGRLALAVTCGALHFQACSGATR